MLSKLISLGARMLTGPSKFNPIICECYLIYPNLIRVTLSEVKSAIEASKYVEPFANSVSGLRDTLA